MLTCDEGETTRLVQTSQLSLFSWFDYMIMFNFRSNSTLILTIWSWRWMALLILLMFSKEGKINSCKFSVLYFYSLCCLLLLCTHCFYFFWFTQYDKENVVEAKFRELEKESCITGDPSDPSSIMQTLKSNTDLLACKAEYYHQCGEYQKCFELTSV